MDKLESLLESYYGMQDEESATRDALDINSSTFNPNEYASQVLSTKSLPELMAYSGQLVQETRSLDRDMQDLVYNNYNKFISATDTIKRMRDSVGEMETNMNKLVTDMRTMGGSSASVNNNLQENRGKIEKFVGVKRLLIKLEFLFELPVRLKRAMELDALAQAVRYYTMVSGVLRKYDHIASIHAIRVDADAIMDKLKEQLRATLRSSKGGVSSASSARVVEAIRLLVQLDEPRPALREAYLAFQRSKLLTTLNAYASRHAPATVDGLTASSSSSASGGQGSGGADGSGLMSDRARAYFALAQAQRAAGASSALATAAAARPRAPISATLFVQGANRSFLEAFRYAADLYVELFEEGAARDSQEGGTGLTHLSPQELEAERKTAHDELLSFTKDVFTEYFSALKRQLALPPPLEGTSSSQGAGDAPKTPGQLGRNKSVGFASPSADAGYEVDEDEAAAARAKASAQAAAAALGDSDGEAGRFSSVTDALKVVITDVRGASRFVKEARLPDRATELTESVLRAQLDGLFADVRGDVARTLVRLQQESIEIVEAAKGRVATGPGQAGGSSEGDEGAPAAGADWAVLAGAALAAAATRASTDVSARIDQALAEAKPLIISGMRLLPDLARAFNGLVHGQVLSLLAWLAAALEACGDGSHAARVEWHGVVVEAESGLEKDKEGQGLQMSSSGSSADAKKRQAQRSTGSSSSSAQVKRRATVNFAFPEADQSAPVPPPAAESSTLLAPAERDKISCYPFLILAAVLAKHFAHNGVARALSTMLQTLPTRSELAAMGLSDGGAGENDGGHDSSYGAMMDVPDLIKSTQGAGKALLRRWAYLHGSRLSNVMRRSLTSSPASWLTHGEPREVRLVVPLILQDVAGLRKLIAAALGDWDASGVSSIASAIGITPAAAADAAPTPSNPFGGAPIASGTSSSRGAVPIAAAVAKRSALVVGAAGTAGAPAGAGSGSAIGGALGMGGVGGGRSRGLPLDMDSLLFKQGTIVGEPGVGSKLVLGAVEFNAESVARVLLRQVLKAQIEWTRTLTLGKGGYMQLQVDLAALHMALPCLLHAKLPASATASGSGSGSSSGGSGVSWNPFSGGLSLEELVREAALSAADRCVEPRPLEAAIIHDIALSKLQSIDLAAALP